MIRDLDCDIIRCHKALSGGKEPFFHAIPQGRKRGILRPVRKNPYLPADETEANQLLEELFDLQIRSLTARLQNTGIKKLVLGVSGGLDSTLCLLVAAKALDALELPRTNLIGVTMPGFGTTDRTYFNALALLEALGADSRDISIKQAVLQHFEDIGHSAAEHDVTYENAQARERAQILLDLANKEKALVLGTGDLSEAALGWSTFAGDHIANYNVNICLTKTMVRRVVDYVCGMQLLSSATETLYDILDTPVSPELLPPDSSGQISQKTEQILGSYELHDFFLFYLVHCHFRPSKVYYYACIAFAGQIEPEEIKDKLKLFVRRFFLSQFKRSCSPDSAIIFPVHLNNQEFYVPSDLSPRIFLEEIDQIETFSP